MLRKIGCSWVASQQRILRASIQPILSSSRRNLMHNFDVCWKCRQKRRNVHELFCDKCNVIQRPHEKDNYFNIFSLPLKFAVDVPSLQRKYRAMQTQLHPDKFANSTEAEKEISAEFSSLVNDAYNTLANPMARALHMLKLHKETIRESDKSSNSEFLMNIMELNEAIENSKTEKELRQLASSNKHVMEQIVKELEMKFEQNDIHAAKQLVIKMKYFHTLSTKIKEAMGNKGIVD